MAVEFIGASGHAAETIAKQADAGGFDLLMMGSHGHGKLGNLVMGSVATQVLASCRLPAAGAAGALSRSRTAAQFVTQRERGQTLGWSR